MDMQVKHGWETALFLLVSVLDVFMTYIVLSTGNFREANLLARFFIVHWGARGMVYFKFAMVAFAVVVIQLIARNHPDIALRLLRLAVVIASCIVIYSATLLLRVQGYF